MQSSAVQTAMMYDIPLEVRSTFTDRKGTKIFNQENIDYTKSVTGVAYSKDDAKITLLGVEDKPGVAANIFEPLHKAQINVDMVIQNISSDQKKTDITFTIKRNDLLKTKEILKNNKDVAVITDAGTPAISDPAYKLVRKAIDIGSKVEGIPGASAVLTALVSSGLPTDRFLFEGFLPPKKGRKKRIENFKNIEATIIIYENNNRLKRTVNQLLEVLGDRPAVLCRELTKVYEEIVRGTLSSLKDILENKSFKGECVLLLSKDDQNIYFD